MSISLKILDISSSLEPLNSIIKYHLENGIKEHEIIVAFDHDGTLTNIGHPLLKKTPNERLRGGETSRQVLNNFTNSGIQWFVISARPVSKSTMAAVSTSFKLLELKIIPNKIIEPDKIQIIQNAFVFNEHNYDAIIYNNIISLAEPGSEYSFDKHVSLEYIISTHYDKYPKLIIFVDDNAKNIMTLYNHYKQMNYPNIHFIGILYEPIKKESDHDEFKVLLDEEIKKFT